jgi:hypothetical protein
MSRCSTARGGGGAHRLSEASPSLSCLVVILSMFLLLCFRPLLLSIFVITVD